MIDRVDQATAERLQRLNEQARQHNRHRRSIQLVCALAFVAALVVVGGKLIITYFDYGNVGWGPSPAPPKFHYQGSEYDRGYIPFELQPYRVKQIPATFTPRGHVGGSTIYAEAPGTGPRGPNETVYLRAGNTYVGYGCHCGGG